MPIRSIAVSNFKSFRHLTIEPARFTLIIGSNASGKSNFIQIFKFLRDIAKYGLNNAISLQGGVEYLRNTIIGPSENCSFRIVYRLDERKQDVIGLRDRVPIYFESAEVCYEFSLRFREGAETYEIESDRLIVSGDFQQPEGENLVTIGPGEVMLCQVSGEVRYCFHPPEGFLIRNEDQFPHMLQRRELTQNRLIMNIPVPVPGIPPLEWIFRGMKVYDFDPQLLKKAVPMIGKTALEKDGNNLAIVVKNISDDPEKKRIFSSLLKDMLPFVDDVAVEKFMDMSLFLKIKEIYNKDRYIPASMISDGTLNIIALIIALYFEDRPVTVIEEPERNIHPHLISRLIDMLKDAARHKQVIITTHNPEMVKYVAIEDILLVSRDAEGFSTLSKPADAREVQNFLEQEIGIEDLFIQNLLGME
jgi:predicted ATPase